MNIGSLGHYISSWLPVSHQNLEPISEQLQSAVKSHSFDEVVSIIEGRPDLLSKPLPNGEHLLHYAIRQGQEDIVTWIAANHPAVLTYTDDHGLTPFDHAVLSRNNKIAGIILGHRFRADCDAVASQFSGRSSFFSSKKEIAFARSVSEYCTPAPAGLKGVFKAAEEGDLLLVRDLLNKGLDVNSTTTDGWSLLHLAVRSGNEDLVDLLIGRNARLDLVTTPHGVSALHVAAMGNNRRLIQRLEEKSVDLSAKDKYGSTALHYAMTKDELFSAQLLIENGCSCLEKNNSGMTPLAIMAALANMKSDSRDALKIDKMQYAMFAGVVASCLSAYYPHNSCLDVLKWAARVAPTAMTFRSTSKWGKGAFLIGSCIPGINIGAQLWETRVVSRACLEGIKTAWKHRHLETVRPLRNLAILGANMLYSIKSLFDITVSSYNLAEYLVDEYSTRMDHEYLFNRDRESDSLGINNDASLRAFELVKSRNGSANIDFDKDSLFPFDNGGTCSAMALDFVARINNECVKILGKDEFIECVLGKNRYYLSSTEEHKGVQAAYNTIKVVGSYDTLSPDAIAAQKMQALASYHNMTLIPASKTLDGRDELVGTIEGLPIGSYVVRLLSPEENHKLESFGHTMAFIKRDDTSIFYDNFKGARLVEDGTASSVAKSFKRWWHIPTIRFYRAECPDQGCDNLMQDQIRQLSAIPAE